MNINFSEYSAINGTIVAEAPVSTYKGATGVVSSALQQNENLVIGTVILAPENHAIKKGDSIGFLRSQCYKLDNEKVCIDFINIKLHKKQ